MGKKNQLKQEVARLNEVIQQQSSQHAVIVSQTPKERRIVEAAKSWMGEVISEGVQAIIDMTRVIERIKNVEEMIHDLIASLAQEPNTLKEILNDWDEMAKSDLDPMVTCDVLPSCEMFYRCHGLMGYKEETLRKLVKSFRQPQNIVS